MLQRSVSLPPSRPLIGRTLPESLETLLGLGKSLGSWKWGEQQPLAPVWSFCCWNSLRSKRSDTGVRLILTNILGRLCIVPRPAASRLHVVRGPRVGNQRKRCPNCCYSHVVPLWRQRFHTAHCSRNCQAWCHCSFSSIFIHFPRPKSRPAPTKVK